MVALVDSSRSGNGGISNSIRAQEEKRNIIWAGFLVSAIVALLIIGVTIYWNFFGPYRPQDDQLKYASAQLVFTTVGISGIVFSLLFATR